MNNELIDIWDEIDALKEELAEVRLIRETMVKHHAELEQLSMFLRTANEQVEAMTQDIKGLLKGGGTK